MKRFLVFWDSGNDQQDVADGYADQAKLHAKSINKTIRTKVIDTQSSDSDKSFWDSPNTIECVTVDDTTKKDTALTPSDGKINEMVDDL